MQDEAAYPPARRSSFDSFRSTTIHRFSVSTRLLHWLNAITFLVLLASGLLLFIPELKAPALDGYRLLPLLHIAFGVAFLAAPLLLVLLARERQAVIRDVA